MTSTVEAVYEEHVKLLSVREKLQLVSKITQELSDLNSVDIPEHSLLELEGLGAEIWEKIDIDNYINELRSETSADKRNKSSLIE
ncbi:MAG: hypothetical protein KDJ65_16990 [Anaerolineae bacterium]|nr:hypothetical protein [Anaerolineae bacterium]